MPVEIPLLSNSFFENLVDYSFEELSFFITKSLFKGVIPEDKLEEIIKKSITFPAPLVSLNDQIHVLELFHGPSLAFKDFGARFMAQLMSYFNKGEKEDLIILVATSGDTGGAVASGFYDTPGVSVVILYPSGKVSPLQEKQLTTLGKNITAFEVDGTFDDCQRMVKSAFLDAELNKKLRLTSANSINIARLIPQSFYYFEAYKQLIKKDRVNNASKVVFSVPSGNFGNLTAGLFAKKMGLPVFKFIAATNINDVVPEYLDTSVFKPRPSVRTISNAMDVGNPSNFTRMLDLFNSLTFGGDSGECSTWNNMRSLISGYKYSDFDTAKGVLDVYQKYSYCLDPHGAVGFLALSEAIGDAQDLVGILLETAHPAKFLEVYDNTPIKVTIPERLASLAAEKKESVLIENDFDVFKSKLLS